MLLLSSSATIFVIASVLVGALPSVRVVVDVTEGAFALYLEHQNHFDGRHSGLIASVVLDSYICVPLPSVLLYYLSLSLFVPSVTFKWMVCGKRRLFTSRSGLCPGYCLLHVLDE